MKVEVDNLSVGFSDLASILEGNGEYTLDDGFMRQAHILAKHAISQHLDLLRHRIEESDNRFPLTEGLLEKLELLDEVSGNDLSRMLHILSVGGDGSESLGGEAGFTPDHAPALMEYVYERLELLDQAVRLATEKMRTYPPSSMPYKIAYMNYLSLRKEETEYTKYLGHLSKIIQDAHVPGED